MISNHARPDLSYLLLCTSAALFRVVCACVRPDRRRYLSSRTYIPTWYVPLGALRVVRQQLPNEGSLRDREATLRAARELILLFTLRLSFELRCAVSLSLPNVVQPHVLYI